MVHSPKHGKRIHFVTHFQLIMISPREINRAAALNKVSDRQIEKDYVLSWVLYAISCNSKLKEALVFKGGTVLKKSYFRDYRFSEDLDFTLLDETMENETIKKEFEVLFHFIKEETNMDLNTDPRNWTVHGSGSPQFHIDYVSSLRGTMGSRNLKIDITRGEQVLSPVAYRSIFRDYSDLEKEFILPCYSLVEVLIEKMAALMGRTEPRDLYDLWFLTELEGMQIPEHLADLERKARHKGQDPEKFLEKVLKKEAGFRKEWQNKLGSQIHDLPPFDEVFRGVKRQCR